MFTRLAKHIFHNQCLVVAWIGTVKKIQFLFLLTIPVP